MSHELNMSKSKAFLFSGKCIFLLLIQNILTNLLKTQIPNKYVLFIRYAFTLGSCDNNRGICVFGALTSVDALFYFRVKLCKRKKR